MLSEYPTFLERLANIDDIATAAEERLEREYNASLAEIKYRYLMSSSQTTKEN